MNNDKTERIIELLEEILKWIKFTGWQNVKTVLSEALNDDISKLVYHYSDGRSSREVAEKVSISHTQVTKYWKKWANLGIVEPISARRAPRYKKLFSLEDVGVEIPSIDKGSGEDDEQK